MVLTSGSDTLSSRLGGASSIQRDASVLRYSMPCAGLTQNEFVWFGLIGEGVPHEGVDRLDLVRRRELLLDLKLVGESDANTRLLGCAIVNHGAQIASRVENTHLWPFG